MEDVVAMMAARSAKIGGETMADFSEDGMGLLGWLRGLLSARRDRKRAEQEERHFEPDQRRQLDEAARNAARGAESGVTSVTPISGP
jgi:hypothetical protein